MQKAGASPDETGVWAEENSTSQSTPGGINETQKKGPSTSGGIRTEGVLSWQTINASSYGQDHEHDSIRCNEDVREGRFRAHGVRATGEKTAACDIDDKKVNMHKLLEVLARTAPGPALVETNSGDARNETGTEDFVIASRAAREREVVAGKKTVDESKVRSVNKDKTFGGELEMGRTSDQGKPLMGTEDAAQQDEKHVVANIIVSLSEGRASITPEPASKKRKVGDERMARGSQGFSKFRGLCLKAEKAEVESFARQAVDEPETATRKADVDAEAKHGRAASPATDDGSIGESNQLKSGGNSSCASPAMQQQPYYYDTVSSVIVNDDMNGSVCMIHGEVNGFRKNECAEQTASNVSKTKPDTTSETNEGSSKQQTMLDNRGGDWTLSRQKQNRKPATAASTEKCRGEQDGNDHVGGMTKRIVWQCAVCFEEVFDSYDECVAHETDCVGNVREAIVAGRAAENQASDLARQVIPQGAWFDYTGAAPGYFFGAVPAAATAAEGSVHGPKMPHYYPYPPPQTPVADKSIMMMEKVKQIKVSDGHLKNKRKDYMSVCDLISAEEREKSKAVLREIDEQDAPSASPANSGFTSLSSKPAKATTSSSQVVASSTHFSINNPPTSLAIQSDATFLDPVHIFIRSTCIELFVSTQEHLKCSGRGARASRVGQVGLRCAFCKTSPQAELTRQAVMYPSKRETIFESVRNYQRVHLEVCPCMPMQMRAKYERSLHESDDHVGGKHKRSQRFVRAYYKEAASELGLTDSSKGLVFAEIPNTSGRIRSEILRRLIVAAEDPEAAADFWKQYNASKTVDKSLELQKFGETLASERTREIIRKARSEASPFVYPQDFPTVSDFEFLLFKQVLPCRPGASTFKRRGIDPEEFKSLSGICCKHCARASVGDSRHSGMYFPANEAAFVDSSFSQSLLNHIMGCKNVPQDLKDAFEELKQLASDNHVTAKRGSRKQFVLKIWSRMENYYADEGTS